MDTVQDSGRRRRIAAATLAVFGLCGFTAAGPGDKIPITTSSAEARQLYLQGRDLSDKLRVTDSRKFYREALAKDPSFARAHLDLANVAGTNKEFFDELKSAVALAPKASEAERSMILGLEAGVKGDVGAQKAYYTKLVGAFPADERAHNLLGGFHFGQQEFATAIEEYKKATALAPTFSQPYNQLGYAYRFLGNYAEAEQAFKKYIDLIPNDPNPYDSYAELLMKMGRFEDSIKSYEKALSFDPNFIASYIGIGLDRVFLGRGDEARKSFEKLGGVARNNGERRQAFFWTAVSHVYEGAPDKALAEIAKMSSLATADGDGGALSGDANLAANILLEAGDADKAASRFADGLQAIDKADVPAEVKQAAHRNDVYDQARLAIVRKDLKGAREKAAEYARQVGVKAIPFEVRQHHELEGRLALEDKNWALALSELQQASQQDPRVLYLTAVALQGKGDRPGAKQVLTRAADFNENNPNYAYVRTKAKEMLAKL